MAEEIDIWRTANLLIQRHGEYAFLVAAQCADRMIEKGDPAGEAVWQRVLEAVLELQRVKPDGKPH